MEFAGSLPSLPFRKKLRRGQKRTVEKSSESGRKHLCTKLPTGYGKTFTAACIYSLRKMAGNANRLLVVFPTDKQLEQFQKDGPADLRDAGVDGCLTVVDVRYYKTESIKKHRQDKAQIYAITIQSLIQDGGLAIVQELMRTGLWMVVVDEYHHYGEQKKWGQTILGLQYGFLLAMSATPYRPARDGAFGPPEVIVTYREAEEEKAVKPLVGHSYHYRIDVLTEDNSPRSFTTEELVKEVGSDSPDAIEKHLITRKMRWSPKYISPLVQRPIERMMIDRLSKGFLQVIVGAMCVSHAKIIYQQIREMFPELRVDWVGTGENGRSVDENKKVLDAFCPPKDEYGVRHPKLDVIVHVGMAGEGLDTIYVSEIIHANGAEVNNSNNQENGRASRFLEGVTATINFDGSSGYAKGGYTGSAIMDAMDELPPQETSPKDTDDSDDLDDLPSLPEEPFIHIYDMELERVDIGDPDVQLYAKVVVQSGLFPQYSLDELTDPDSPLHLDLIAGYRNMRRKEAEQHNEQSTIEQWREAVSNALRGIVGRAIRILANGHRVEKSIAGDLKKRVNSRKKLECGELTASVDVCKKHYNWLVKIDKAMQQTRRLPEWLE